MTGDEYFDAREKAIALVTESLADWISENPEPKKISVKILHDWVIKELAVRYGVPDFKIIISSVTPEKEIGDEDELRVRSLVLIGEQRAEIFVDSSCNHCWRRFCITKELIHIILDREFNEDHKFSIEDFDEVAREVVYTNIFNETCEKYRRMKWEKIGTACAARYLVPNEYKEFLTQDLSADEILENLEEWAEMLKVPVKALAAYFSPFSE